MNAQTFGQRATRRIPQDVDLTALMCLYGVRSIWRDTLLDRYHVTLTDYSSGQGGSVGEALEQALADAERQAA